MKKIFDWIKKHQLLLGFLTVFLIAFVFRDAVAERDLKKLEKTTGARFAPFLVESAVMYGYINDAASGKNIAGSDPDLPTMKNFRTAEQMTLSLEYAGGAFLKLYRCFSPLHAPGEYELSYPESRALRRMFTLFIALAPAFIYLMLRFFKVPCLWALSGAALEIFSAAALGRYTGQDLIKGAFAWPFIAMYLASYAAVLHGSIRQKKCFLVLAMLSSLSAIASWDAASIIIALLAVSDIIRTIICRNGNARLRNFYLMTLIAMIMAALLIPYYRLHGFFFSPVIQFALPGVIVLQILPQRKRRLWSAAVLVLLAVWSYAAIKISPFGSNYQHFADLLLAKLKFFNRLPSDPNLLTFDQRYLWTPELHSANWKLTQMLYPAALPMLAAALIVYLVKTLLIKRSRPALITEKIRGAEIIQWLILTAAAFLLYIFMARFRDMTMLFTAIALPLTCTALAGRKPVRWVYCTLSVLLLLGVACEWRNSRHLRRAYPEGLKQTAALVRHLRQYDLSGKTFLSDMQNSSLLKGYTDAAIIIQPKYELPEVRELTQKYLLTFFNAPLNEFTKYCADNNVDYVLIHIPMITTPAETPYSYRYMTCTNKLVPGSAAHRLGLGSEHLKNYCEISLPKEISNINGYRLYRFIPPVQRARAEKLCSRALEAYYLGKHARAVKLISGAYHLAPGMGEIYEVYTRICRTIPPPADLPAKGAHTHPANQR